MTATELPDLRYDPFDYEIDRNAHAVWARLRDEAPLYRNDEHDFWAVSRYDDVLAGLLDIDTYRSGHGTVLDMMTAEQFPMPMFIFRDPPDHTLMRKLVSRAFTPRAIGGLEERITQICDELLDPFAGADRFDYVDHFAAILPPTVILALLGFPAGFADSLRESMDSNLHLDDGEVSTSLSDPANRTAGSVIDEAGNLGSAVFDQLPALCKERRANPTDDMLTVLATHELERADGSSSPLTNEEILSYTALIAGAGAETVARMLGWAAVLLSRHPDQRALLQADPTLIPNAIEEVLRYEAPSPVQARWVEHDVEVHGTTIAAGSKMLLLDGSGNRDPRHFKEPDTFDVRRKIDRHLSFGYGAHFCIGAALARLEGRIALEQTIARFGDWYVDEAEVEWVHTSTVRGYHRVPMQVSN